MTSALTDRTAWAVDPLSRGIAMVAGITGAFLCRDLSWLILAWFVLLAAICASNRTRLAHLRFLAVIWTPLFFALLLVWGIIVGAAPGQALHSSARMGFLFAATTATRILLLAAIVQLAFLTLRADELIPTVRRWRLGNEGLVALLGAVALVPEIQLRLDQIITARTARGLIPNNSWWRRAQSVPTLLPPLVAWVLRSALQRGEMWEHRDILSRLPHRAGPAERVTRVGWVVIGGSLAWLVVAAITRWSNLPWRVMS